MPTPSQHFLRYQLRLPNEVLVGPSGEAINGGLVPGTPLYQWMDPDLARAWFAEARRQAGIARSTLAPLTAQEITNGFMGRGTGRPDGGAAMRAGFAAMMYGFNALNIPWYMYAPSRTLWRKYAAGPPQVTGTNAEHAEYDGLVNYNNSWFTPQSDYPGWSSGLVTQQTAYLAASTPGLGDISQVRNTPSVFPWLQVPYPFLSATNSDANDPLYARNAENSPAVGDGFPDTRVGDPWRQFRAVPLGNYRFYDNPRGSAPPAQDLGNWTVYSYDNPDTWIPGAFKRIGAPPVAYLPWLEEWSSMMADADPSAVVVASRVYTAYRNAKSSSLNGGDAAFLGAVATLPGEVLRSQTTGSTQTALQGAAALSATLGAALAPVTYGISGVIGGGIALALSVASTQVRNAPHVARDEFGRYKPVLERGWLSGDPTDASDSGTPPIVIPGPPNWVRPQSILPLLAPIVGSPNLDLSGGPNDSRGPGGRAPGIPGPDFTTPLVVLAVGAGVVYVGYQLLRPRDKTRRSGRTRTR